MNKIRIRILTRLFVQERYSEKSGGHGRKKYHTEQNTLSQIEAIERVRKTQSEGEKAF